MQYLVGQMLMCLLIAGLIGLVIGWAIWGMLLQKSRERATEMEQRVAKLSGYPARLADLEGTHAAFVASRNEESAKCKARIAELELVAAKLPELEKSLAARTSQWEALNAQFESQTKQLADLRLKASAADESLKAKDAQIAEHVHAHEDKDARLTSLVGRIADLDLVAVRVPQLEAQLAQVGAAHAQKAAEVEKHVAAHREKDARIAELAPLAALVPALREKLSAKEVEAAGLTAKLDDAIAAHAEKATELERHADANREKDEHIEQLMAEVDAMKPQVAEIPRLKAEHADKDARIAELAALAALAPELQAKVDTHRKHIDELTAAHAEKDAQIAQLTAAHAEKDSQIGELKAQVDAQGSHLQQLAAEHAAKDVQLSELTLAHSAKDAHVAELAALAALVPALTATHEEKDSKIAKLVDQVSQHEAAHADLKSRLEGAEYESNLANRKLRMAEASSVAMASAQGQAEPLKARAAAASMGFYDAGPALTAPVAVEPLPDQTEYYKELLAKKDAEIAKLTSRLTDIESEADPDVRRQILLAAKNAELTHLRGVFNSLFQPLNQDEVAMRAYSYAKERSFKGGSPIEDWLRAERDTHFSRLGYAWESTRSGTMF